MGRSAVILSSEQDIAVVPQTHYSYGTCTRSSQKDKSTGSTNRTQQVINRGNERTWSREKGVLRLLQGVGGEDGVYMIKIHCLYVCNYQRIKDILF